MAKEQEQQQSSAAETTQQTSLLEQVISAAPKATKKDRMQDMLASLVGEVTKGTVKVDKSIVKTVNAAIKRIDELMSEQLNAVMHSEPFLKFEGTWRGLNYLVMNSETGEELKIRVFNVSKKDLAKDLENAPEFDQSQMFKKLYESEFGMAGGEPYGAMVGDYEFTNHPEDLSLLQKISNVAAAAHCPFLSSASPELFGFEKWTDLSNPRDLAKIFDTVEYTQWKSFRDSEDSRYTVLTLPRTLARLPYGSLTKSVETFQYEEGAFFDDGKPKAIDHSHYCWMNAAYVLGTKLTDAFAQTGWCTAIRGVENGGKVENLPAHVFKTTDGEMDLKCPTEVGITDRREAELSKLGFLPLCHFKNTDYSVFFGAQTTQKPKKYDNSNATANANISARLPYMMAASRIAHFLKVIARDKIGSFKELSDMETWLHNWIHQYVTPDKTPSAETKARYPLAEAKINVEAVEGQPGSYRAVAFLRPWLQMEELTTSLRMVANIPGGKK